MSRRVTVPEGHDALILPNQLTDELVSLLKEVRRQTRPSFNLVSATNSNDQERDARVTDRHMEMALRHSVAGDVMLAILEGKEA